VFDGVSYSPAYLVVIGTPGVPYCRWLDVFDLQDEIRARVLGALAPNIEMLELARARAKPTAILDAYDLTLRAHATLRLAVRESAHEAIQLCAAANRLDPDYALPYAIAGMSYTQLKAFNWMSEPAAEIAKASWFARRAIQLGPDNPMVLSWAGHIVSNIDRDLETGSRTCERALSISPNYAPALVYTAFARIWNGEPEVAVERLKRAFRLSPVDPDIPWWHAVLAHAHFHSEDYSRAVSAALVALTDAELPDALRILAASYGHAGASEKALATVSRLQRVSPALSLSTLRETLGPYGEGDFHRYYEGLRLAGLPE
jgi:adenylate cyclase